jgi:hypothetical protein
MSRINPIGGAAYGRQPIRIGLYVLLGSVIASFALANLRMLSATERSGADRALLQLVAMCGVALLACDGLRSRNAVHVVLRTVVTLTSCVAALGLLQFAFALDIAPLYQHIPGLQLNHALALVKERVAFPRVAGTASHPIELGVVCAMVLPIALHYARHARTSVWRWGQVAVLGLAIPATVSRSGILALIVAGLVYVPVWPMRERLLALVAIPIALAPARFVVPGLLGTLKNLFARFASDPSVQARTEDYATTSAYISQHPWFGRGYGTYAPPTFPILDNQYLGQLVEVGVIGLLSLVLLGALAFGTARGIRRHSTESWERDLGQALAASVAAAFVAFATYDFFAFGMGTGLLFLLIGVIGALWRLARFESQPIHV